MNFKYIIKLILCANVLLMLACGSAVADYWNTSWSSRQDIILTGNTSGVQTDYQILLNVSWLTGMQADFDDLRFANDTHKIDSWLESKVDGSYALILVEFPTTPANGANQTYRLYYENAEAVSDWNATATFSSFFDGDSTGWIEEDPNFHLSFVNDRLEFTNLNRGEDAYVYQSFTQADWVCEETYAITAATAAGILISPATSDEIDDVAGTANAAFVQYYKGASSFSGLRIDSASYNGGEQTIPLGTYYLRTTKSGNTITMDWYSDSARTNQVYTSTVTQAGLPPLSYLYMLNTWNSGNSGYTVSGWIDDFTVRNYAANPPTYAFGSIQYYTDSIHYNTTNPYNHTIESDGTITVNHTITATDDINWTAIAVSNDCQLVVTEYNLSGDTVANFTLYTASLDWLKVTNLTALKVYSVQYTNETLIEQHTADGNGIVSFNTNLVPNDYQIVLITHPFLSGAYLFYDGMGEGLTDFKDGIGKYLIWGVIFFGVALAFAIFTKIKRTLIGGK